MGLEYGEIAGISLFSTLRFGLLRARTTGGAPLPPLEVNCKPLWQPENVARAFCPIRVSRTLDRMPLRKSCLSANEQLYFIPRLAYRFRAAAGSACKCFGMRPKNLKIVVT